MIRNLNSIRNQIKEIQDNYEEYDRNGIAFMGCATDKNTNETSMGFIGDPVDFFYMMSAMCVSFYDNAGMKKEFSHREFADYICDGIVKTFDAVGNKK